jgi:uncharacterized protein YegP (UPF0339 family)
MAKVIEVYTDKAGEYRWRKIKGSKNVANQGEGHPSKDRTMANAEAESENGEYEVRDLTVSGAPDPELPEEEPKPPVESER